MADKENIVLVTVDSLRADHCGFMGYDEDTTPTLDRLAEDGLVFENAISPGPSTHESTTAIFTGEYPIDRGSVPLSERSGQEEVAQRMRNIRQHMSARESLAERLSEMGYETGAFTSNPWTSRFFDFDHGFDHFEDFMDTDSTSEQYENIFDGGNSTPLYLMRLLKSWRDGQNMFKSWEVFYDDIVEWTENAEEPYFLWIFLVDAHMPYLVPKEFQTQSPLLTYPSNMWLYLKDKRFAPLVRKPLMRSYDDSIRYVDAFLDELSSDLADDLLVVHADHGEGFGEHGRYGHCPLMYEEFVRVPFVVANGPSRTIERPVSLRSMPEIITTLANGSTEFELPPVADSRTLNGTRLGVRGRDWKYIRNPDGSDELYDLADPTEQVETTNPELRELGSDVVDDWKEAKAEQKRVEDAARTVAETGVL